MKSTVTDEGGPDGFVLVELSDEGETVVRAEVRQDLFDEVGEQALTSMLAFLG